MRTTTHCCFALKQGHLDEQVLPFEQLQPTPGCIINVSIHD
jgi:hypothetical protein